VHEFNHSHASNAEIKNEWSYTSTHRDDIIFVPFVGVCNGDTVSLL
jgi:hypothetical protein